MPTDNAIYDRLANTWWDEEGMLHFLQTGMNPVRFGYFRGVLVERLHVRLNGLRMLDIGCGGGLMAEEFARVGCDVTGVDPSRRSVAVAHDHALATRHQIDYVAGVGELLPFGDSTFDVVYCCDALEHVADVDAVIGETARVRKPGGVYFYDTINRTLVSRLAVVKLAQDWRITRLAPPGLHDASMFIKPRELVATMARHGVANREAVGIWPSATPLSLLRTVVLLKVGRISYLEAGRRIRFRESRIIWMSYMGYGENEESVIG